MFLVRLTSELIVLSSDLVNHAHEIWTWSSFDLDFNRVELILEFSDFLNFEWAHWILIIDLHRRGSSWGIPSLAFWDELGFLALSWEIKNVHFAHFEAKCDFQMISLVIRALWQATVFDKNSINGIMEDFLEVPFWTIYFVEFPHVSNLDNILRNNIEKRKKWRYTYT